LFSPDHHGRGTSELAPSLPTFVGCIFPPSTENSAWKIIMTTAVIPTPQSATAESAIDSEQTTCSIVGGGPGGMMLALLLARKRVRVTLLEAHKDFDREFRGDTLHPSVLEILDEIGLAEPLHKLRHVKIYGPTLRAANTSFNPIDLRRLKTKFPYIMLIPQTKFLEFIADEASKYPEFRLKMTANVESLIEENGRIRGVRYLSIDGWHEVRAVLTVGADGRFSKVRHLGGFEPIKTSPPMDILWFLLPHMPEDPQEDSGRVRGDVASGRRRHQLSDPRCNGGGKYIGNTAENRSGAGQRSGQSTVEARVADAHHPGNSIGSSKAHHRQCV